MKYQNRNLKQHQKKRIDEALVKNPHITLKDNNWIYTENDKQEIITQHKDISTETGPLANEYIGRSSALNMEVF